jgi:hypothetical protein
MQSIDAVLRDAPSIWILLTVDWPCGRWCRWFGNCCHYCDFRCLLEMPPGGISSLNRCDYMLQLKMGDESKKAQQTSRSLTRGRAGYFGGLVGCGMYCTGDTSWIWWTIMIDKQRSMACAGAVVARRVIEGGVHSQQ